MKTAFIITSSHHKYLEMVDVLAEKCLLNHNLVLAHKLSLAKDQTKEEKIW